MNVPRPASPTAPDALAPEAVRGALDDVLADERLRQNPLSAWIGERLERLAEALFGDGGGGGTGIDLSFLLTSGGWVLLALVVIALTLFVASRVGRRARAAELEAAAPDGVRARVAELLAEARAAEGAGDLLRALRLYFFALVVGLGERGELRYRDAWTNRELFERGRPSAELRARLAPIVADLDRKSFGGEVVAPTDVRRLEGLCATWLPGVVGADGEAGR